MPSAGSIDTDFRLESETFSPTADAAAVAAIAGAYHSTPFDVLGMHQVTVGGKAGLAIRTFQPQAAAVSVNRNGVLYAMTRIHPEGFFETVFPGETGFFAYRLSVTLGDTRRYEIEDPYRFPPVLSDFDLHLFGEGNHLRLYEKHGAHLIDHAGVRGRRMPNG
jgi:1,4-alpha-glucan branching enzyme